MSTGDAASTFEAQLGHIASLEYPGCKLMCVITGPACNDSIEQTVSLEQRLLNCIVQRGGVTCADLDGGGSRGGRLGNVVVAFIRPDPSSCVVDACCVAAAAAAAQQAKACQTASVVFTDVAQKFRADSNMKDAAKWQQEADKKTREARAALARNKLLTFNAHNSSFHNSWCIDLHGQSEASAVSRVEQLLLVCQSIGHPGGINLRIITGKGKHSVNQIAKVRPAVLDFLAEEVAAEFHCENGVRYMLRYQDHDGANDGVVLVDMSPASDESASAGTSAAAAAAAGWA